MEKNNYFKKLLPIKSRYYIKHGFEYFLGHTINLTNKKSIILIDAASYNNLGDQAISFSINKFVECNFIGYEYVEVLENEFMRNLHYLKKNIKKEDIIFLNGGGNMGDLYPKYEAIRRIVIEKFSKNKIIIFPQTIDYSDTAYGNRELKISEKIYNSHPNLFICARENRSYNIMKLKYYKCRVELIPDIVLYLSILGCFNTDVQKNYNIGVCLRSDKESVLDDEMKRKINSLAKSINFLSTISDVKYIDSANREKLLKSKIDEFSKHDLIITDRLHGMIFSILAGVKCIAFDNSNKKISGVYETIKSYCDNVCIATKEDFYEKYINIKEKKSHFNIDVDVFEKLIFYVMGDE